MKLHKRYKNKPQMLSVFLGICLRSTMLAGIKAMLLLGNQYALCRHLMMEAVKLDTHE